MAENRNCLTFSKSLSVEFEDNLSDGIVADNTSCIYFYIRLSLFTLQRTSNLINISDSAIENFGIFCSRVLISTSPFDGDYISDDSAEIVTQICD